MPHPLSSLMPHSKGAGERYKVEQSIPYVLWRCLSPCYGLSSLCARKATKLLACAVCTHSNAYCEPVYKLES